MTQDDVTHGELFEHHRGDFSGKRAHAVFIHVLCSEANIGIKNCTRDLGKSGEGRADDHVHLFDVGQFQLEAVHQVERFGHRLIHLPVSGNDQFAVFVHFQDLSLSAATPGSSLPSRNSRLAPPPVLIKVTLSASLAWFSAFTLSPPPMMLFAPWFCVASATARAI